MDRQLTITSFIKWWVCLDFYNSLIANITTPCLSASVLNPLMESQPMWENKKMPKSSSMLALIDLRHYSRILVKNIFCRIHLEDRLVRSWDARIVETQDKTRKIFITWVSRSKISRMFMTDLKNSWRERSSVITNVKPATRKLISKRKWQSISSQTHWSFTCNESHSILKSWKTSSTMINLTFQIS